ncbi:hypothetical protein BV898_10474 [Hypsibius exemplaris]|uniref:Uncharacterized protein n=1 Tax=Hypsibius exemplaris TaxID=2072580 RepID=A0A1W0WJG9_HYPEX|nr:hypothetical protein BV898_10474 [Hypsibius exemplaris]
MNLAFLILVDRIGRLLSSNFGNLFSLILFVVTRDLAGRRFSGTHYDSAACIFIFMSAKQFTFCVFIGCTLLTGVYIAWRVPETKGKTVEKIQALLQARFHGWRTAPLQSIFVTKVGVPIFSISRKISRAAKELLNNLPVNRLECANSTSA